MPFDGVTTKFITEELNEKLKGGRIRKVYQPESDEIRLTVNINRENPVLLVSANPNNTRVHLTETTKGNPDVPPTFCMSLRKHLTNAEILGFEQLGTDRVLSMNLRSVDEFGEPCVKKLVCEVTGRNSNIILVQESGGEAVILDSLKRVGSTKSRFRQILPGKPYTPPPSDGRRDFTDVSTDELVEEMGKKGSQSIEQFLTLSFLGVSPVLAREVAYRAKLDSSTLLNQLAPGETRRLASAFNYLIDHLGEGAPAVYSHNRQILDFYGVKLNHLGAEEQTYDTFSQMLEAFYSLRDKRMHFRTRSANLRHQLEALRKKSAKKLQNLDRDLKKSSKNDKNKLYGDLITANIWQLERGMGEAELWNYMVDPPVMVKVPLKVNETPSQNAQRFYNKYSKNKRAQQQLAKQIAITTEELDYIESLLNALSTSTELEELDEISYEFNHSSLVPAKGKRQQKEKKPKPSRPMHFVSSEGFDIYVGKNNYQNDYISTRLGQAEDCWLHVKDAPGSHVLIVADGKFITEQTVLEGGMLAAHYSKMGSSENIPVDYMEFKFVKKPKNAKPGLVTFTEHNTMYITPDMDVLDSLQKVE